MKSMVHVPVNTVDSYRPKPIGARRHPSNGADNGGGDGGRSQRDSENTGGSQPPPVPALTAAAPAVSPVGEVADIHILEAVLDKTMDGCIDWITEVAGIEFGWTAADFFAELNEYDWSEKTLAERMDLVRDWLKAEREAEDGPGLGMRM
jgi:hypothetical protein